MKIPDANLLLYAVNEDAAQHEKAKAWLKGVLSGSEPVGFDWTVLIAFLRISTNPRASQRPRSPGEAWGFVEAWLASEVAWVPTPTDNHGRVLEGLIKTHHITGKLVNDADLAALAIEHGLTVISADTDFARFPEIRWENPIAPQAPRR